MPANSASAAMERLCQLCELGVARTLVPFWLCVTDSMWCLPWEPLGWGLLGSVWGGPGWDWDGGISFLWKGRRFLKGMMAFNPPFEVVKAISGCKE